MCSREGGLERVYLSHRQARKNLNKLVVVGPATGELNTLESYTPVEQCHRNNSEIQGAQELKHVQRDNQNENPESWHTLVCILNS